jgi:uncharacterized protein
MAKPFNQYMHGCANQAIGPRWSLLTWTFGPRKLRAMVKDGSEAQVITKLLAWIQECDIIWIMKIEWDPIKARDSFKKHRVSFEEAATALSDPMAATGPDPDHSIYEERYITFGVSEEGRLLVVSHTEEGENIRIISARKASKGERELYEER